MSTDKPAKRAPKASTFSAAELEAMQEAKAERKKGKKADGEADLLAKIAEMDASDRAIAERLHGLVKENAPELSPKTWYGMPAWANADGKVVCFFTAAGKFKTRYASFGFQEDARLDDGSMWPTAFALTRLTEADEKRIAALLKKAVA
ncbi:iron chaperone [Devosia sp. XGJD_8]|jgi:uncharacterized protein YdhG (YjbR/CyaY superfamily)|uniref:iron chaperone n=1 Tax=Devosia sp. XGJD_8 TaxID=3391187 RepID=UPI0039848DE1